MLVAEPTLPPDTEIFQQAWESYGFLDFITIIMMMAKIMQLVTSNQCQTILAAEMILTSILIASKEVLPLTQRLKNLLNQSAKLDLPLDAKRPHIPHEVYDACLRLPIYPQYAEKPRVGHIHLHNHILDEVTVSRLGSSWWYLGWYL